MGAILEKVERQKDVVFAMNLIKIFSEEVFHHCYSVAELTEKMLENDETYSNHEKEEIVKGAVLHDIGKIFVPFNLTAAPKRLTEEEYLLIQTHTIIGYEVVNGSFSKIVENVVRYHHEKPNGIGYTDGLKLAQIPREALLVQVADVYDALVSDRAYKMGYDKKTALKLMQLDSNNFKLDDEYYERLCSVIDEVD